MISYAGGLVARLVVWWYDQSAVLGRRDLPGRSKPHPWCYMTWHFRRFMSEVSFLQLRWSCTGTSPSEMRSSKCNFSYWGPRMSQHTLNFPLLFSASLPLFTYVLCHILLPASMWPLPYLAAWMCCGNEPDLPSKGGSFSVEDCCYMAWEADECAVRSRHTPGRWLLPCPCFSYRALLRNHAGHLNHGLHR